MENDFFISGVVACNTTTKMYPAFSDVLFSPQERACRNAKAISVISA